MKKKLISLFAFALALVMAMTSLPVGAVLISDVMAAMSQGSEEVTAEAEKPYSVQPKADITYSPSSQYMSSEYYARLTSVALTGNQRADIVSVAESQVGYHEGNNSSQLNGGNTSGSGNYTEYNYWYNNSQGISWCALFVSWCARQARIGTNIIETGHWACPESGEGDLNVPFFNRENYTPKSGDLIFFLWDKDAAEGYNWSHVGIVKSVSNGMVYTIEGNNSDAVRYDEYGLNDHRIKGYGVPNYEGSEPAPTPTPVTVSKPTITVAAASDGAKVTLKTSTIGATIYYTTDGTTPSRTSTKYNGAITLKATKTVKAIAVKNGCTDSAVASKAVTIYTVTFKDWDDSTIVTRKVLKGADATPPADPTRPGYTFTGWDKAYTNVQANLTVKAQYSVNAVDKPDITTVSVNEDTGIVTIKWSKPANAHHYTLKFYKASDNTLVETVENITATTYTAELNAGKYYAKVTAYNADGSNSKTSNKSSNFIAPLVWTFVTNKSPALNDAPENGVTIRYIATGKTVKATEFAGAKLSRAKVKYGDDRGWVYYGSLDTVKDPTWVYKVNNSLKMRTGVSIESEELATLPAGTVFVVTEVQGNRGKTTYNGMTGWVTFGLAKRITDPTQFTMPPEGTTLAQGATGEHVQWLQACLWQMGYFCELNGTYDADTEAALKLFKTRHGLSTANGFNNACREKLLDLFTCSTPKITYTISGDNATVTISNINAWGTTHYTTNGSAPTASSTEYTGEFTVARGKTVKAMTEKPCRYDSAVATKTVTPAAYTVTFKNWNGAVLSTQQVASGEAAEAPANPEREGYTFTKWDKSFTNVTSNLVVTAQFTINKYTVKFKNWNGTEISTQTVNHGSAATAPANPTRDGYTFSSWDTAFSSVKSNLIVTAQFTPVTPGKPVIASVSTSNGNVIVTWNAVSNAHHYGVEFYRASDDSLERTVSNISGTSCIIELPAAKYYAKVTAYNIDEAGSKTSNASAVFVAPLVWTFVTNRSVALREGPGNDYNVLVNIGSGKTLKATEIAGAKLSRVLTTYSGHTGWAYFGYCDTVQDPTWVYEVSWSGGQRIIMREEVSTTSTILKYIPNGTRLVITEFDGNRAKTTYDGATGWISIQYTTRLTDPTMLEMPPEGTTLAQGDSGEYIEWLQACLWQMGYFCELNGVYDADTEAALTQFKSRHGLNAAAGFNDECRTKLLDLFTVAKPTVTVNVAEDTAEVSINAPTSRSSAYYTIDESEPTTSSTPYTEPFTVPRGTVVRAFAVKECRYDSSITTKQVLPAPHTVTFKDWNGAVLNEQQVEHGAAAIAPEDPVREGYVFICWDKDFSNIIEDLTVNALYDVMPTEPPVTEPPITEPPVTEPPVTEPPYIEGAVDFTVDSVSAVPGSDVYVDFKINGDYEAHSITVFVDFDPSMLTLNGMTKGEVWYEILDIDGTVMTNTNIAGSARFMAIMPVDVLSAEGTLFTMNFHVGEDVPLGTEIPLTINVQQFAYTPIDGPEVDLEFNAIHGKIMVNYLLGDVNGDGHINASDAILIMRHVLGVITLTDEQMIRADYNQDGQINASDALGIMRYSLNV